MKNTWRFSGFAFKKSRRKKSNVDSLEHYYLHYFFTLYTLHYLQSTLLFTLYSFYFALSTYFLNHQLIVAISNDLCFSTLL